MDVLLTEQHTFVVSNLELCYLIILLTVAALKKISKDEIIATTPWNKFNSTLANIVDLKTDFWRLEIELSISSLVNSKVYDRVASLESHC